MAASGDPNPLVAGEGFRRLRAAGVQVEIATDFQAEAEKLNEPFFHFMRTGRPLVTLKSASTLDGKIAAPEDNTGWITSERARAHVQELRHASDAIITGIGTALADDPQLTDRSGLPRARPLLRVVLDSTLRLPLESRLVQTADDDLIVAATSAASPERRRALENRGVEVRIFDGPRGRVDIRDVISLLGERKMPVRDDRGGQQGELGSARIGRGGQGVPLLRAEDSGRSAIASDGGRHGAHAARRCDSAGAHHAASDPAG